MEFLKKNLKFGKLVQKQIVTRLWYFTSTNIASDSDKTDETIAVFSRLCYLVKTEIFQDFISNLHNKTSSPGENQ